MTIEKSLAFLVEEHNFQYKSNAFRELKGFQGPFYTYSFYNEHGCFTVLYTFQRNEIEYYVSKTYSKDKEVLLSKNISQQVFDELKQKRKKHSNLLKSNNTLIAEIVKEQIKANGEFWGIKVDSTDNNAHTESQKPKKKITALSLPHLRSYVVINGLLCVFTSMFYHMLAMDKGDTSRVFNIVMVVLLTIATPTVLLLTTLSGWSAIVHFDTEKVTKRRWFKKWHWYWDDITEVECEMRRTFTLITNAFPPNVTLKCSSHDHAITFPLNSYIAKNFKKLCPNKQLVQHLKELLAECDFFFLGGFNID